MAIGMFKLSQKQRQFLSCLFIVLNVIQIILGTGMTSSSLYVFIAVSPVLLTEKAEVNFVFAVTGIYGTNVIFHWIIGIRMCRKCFHQAHKKSTSNLLLLWYCAGTNTVVILIIISHYARKSGKHIIKSMKHSITNGMTQYLSDLTWKETIDKLQYNDECCGMTSYEDWHEINWLTKYQIDMNSEIVKRYRNNEHVLNIPVTPWSCCRVDFPMQCLHDPLQQTQYSHIWVDEPTVIKDSINTKGCLEGLKKPILSVINLFVFLASMVFIIHIMTFIISRILYTSSRNAILLNDPEGIAPGWVFGRGDCGYAGGKTLGEIMEITQRQPSLERPREAETKKTKKRFGEMIPKRFRRNKKGAKGNTTDENEISESTNLLKENAFEPEFNSTMQGHKGIDRSDGLEDSGEAWSIEKEFNRSKTLVKTKDKTVNKTKDKTINKTKDAEHTKHAMSIEKELRRLQQ